jgi:hypothetical protein
MSGRWYWMAMAVLALLLGAAAVVTTWAVIEDPRNAWAIVLFVLGSLCGREWERRRE